MGTYGLQELIRRWGHGQLKPEQAIGQILLLLADIHERLQKPERRKELPPRRAPGKTGT